MAKKIMGRRLDNERKRKEREKGLRALKNRTLRLSRPFGGGFRGFQGVSARTQL
jgi:hypothetical protein